MTTDLNPYGLVLRYMSAGPGKGLLTLDDPERYDSIQPVARRLVFWPVDEGGAEIIEAAIQEFLPTAKQIARNYRRPPRPIGRSYSDFSHVYGTVIPLH